ncbi:MAG: SDR family NAD(P)-dependent oxidoreductase, partial [Acidobacteriaceae bacterium]|nr:SDR family NAD(P)-dependent oxidoreductase [Acidobacteriaceae bacterium]
QNLNAIRQIYPEAHRLQVSPTDSSEKIFHKLEMRGQVDHLLWIVSDASAGYVNDLSKGEFVERQQQELLFGFRLIQALLRLGYGARKLSWTVITSQAQAIRASEIPNPAHAGVHGLIGSMAKEYPDWKIRLIDFEANSDYSFDLAFTVPSDPKGNVWACRYGQWYRQQLIEAELAVPTATLYRPGGVYVIIGGAGGVSEAFSEYLIRHYQAQIIWIGRRPKDAAIQAKLNRLTAFGSAPHYIAADAADRQALEQALQKIKAQYGAPRGVVHSAIVLSDKSLANMDETRFKNGLQAKIDVSIRVAQVFAEEPLDFILLFSSIQSFIKAPGQSNYAAGCTFQDAFAAWISNRLPCPVKVMNWGYWGSVGVVATEAYRKRMTLAGLGSIEPAEGMAALEKLLAGPLDQVALIKVTKPDTITELGLSLRKDQRISTAPHLPSLASERSLQDTHSSITPAQVIPPESEQKLKGLSELAVKALWGQLQALGLCVEKKTNLSQWKASVHLLPLYERWFEESLTILAAHKYLFLSGDVCTRADLLSPDMIAVWSEWDKNKVVWSQDPLLKAHVLLAAALKALPEILTGKRPATEIIFPNSSMTLVEEVYKNNPVSDYYNTVLADAVAAYIQERQQQDSACQIRIFEIGAGTGGTSTVIFQKLKPHHNHIAEYCYTDISKAFLAYAKKEYGAHNTFLTYSLFNAEEPLTGQQVEAGSYDLVIAANVLHATKNIRKTVQNAKALLKGNGRLLLNEITGKSLFAHLTFGLLEGWWLYEDDALRIPGCPGLAPETWQSILQEEGFHSVHFLAAQLHGLGQQIIIATSNGIIRQPFATAAPQSTISTQLALSGPHIRWIDRWLASSERHSFAIRSRVEGPQQWGAQATDSRGASAALWVTSPESDRDIDRRLHQIVSALLDIPVGGLEPNVPLERYGLDSIVTLELSRMLRPEFGEISPAVIFECRTIAALARHLNGNKPKPDGQESTLPPELLLLSSGKQEIAKSAAGFPSFWVHGAPGYAQGFRALAQDSESPVYAFQARGIDGGTVPFSDLDAMADYYYQCMVTVAPGQAVVIGGYSLGGVIALEVARRWHAAGNTVAQLVLLDTYPNTPEVQTLFS